MTQELRYPIGVFKKRLRYSASDVTKAIDEIESTPRRLRESVTTLDDAQLDTPYRPDGWTLRQVVHHLPDSHMNSYIRMKLAVTEDKPPIQGYREERWAELPEAANGDVELSLSLLDALHKRWVTWLRSLTEADLAREFVHSELGAVRLDESIDMYAWHGNHHIAHITSLKEREGWR